MQQNPPRFLFATPNQEGGRGLTTRRLLVFGGMTLLLGVPSSCFK